MTSTHVTARRERSRRELALVWSTGLLAALVLGLGAALVRADDFWLSFGVFAACALGPCTGFAWLLLGAGRRVEADTQAEENVEARWFSKAGSAALFDTLAAAGLSAAAISILDVDPPAELTLLALWAFGLADATLRYAVLARREA